MKLGVIRNVKKEDLAKYADLPAWMDPFLSVLDEFINNVTTAMLNRLSFADNFDCKSVTMKFTHNVEQLITIPTGKRAVGVIPVDAQGAPITGFQMSRKNNAGNQVGLTFRFYTVNTTGGTTSGSKVITSVGITEGIYVGMSITGAGIPTGTTVTSVSGSTVNISANATATTAGVALAFGTLTAVTCTAIILTG